MLLVSEVGSSDPIKVMEVFVRAVHRVSWLLVLTAHAYGYYKVGTQTIQSTGIGEIRRRRRRRRRRK
jgi:hypothetical protein